MKLWIAQCYDRHISPVIRVFDTSDAAVAYAKQFVLDCKRHEYEKEEDDDYEGAVYFERFSEEDEYVVVLEGDLNDAS